MHFSQTYIVKLWYKNGRIFHARVQLVSYIFVFLRDATPYILDEMIYTSSFFV